MTPPLIEFLRTGNLGPLALGMARKEVEEILGKPEDSSRSRRNQPVCWKYGNLQVWIQQEVLTFIGLYFPDEQFQLPAVLGELIELPRTLDGLQGVLEEQGIGFRVDQQLTFVDQVALRVGPGIQVVFRWDDGCICLDSIQYAVPKESISGAAERFAIPDNSR